MNIPSRILVACDKFKGSLTAAEACEAISRACLRRWPSVVVDRCPIADGGEGFLEAMAVGMPGRWIECPSHDALGRDIQARYWLADVAGGPVAVMEMAEASGFWRIAAGERDILRASTFGTGEMMRHAVEAHHVNRIVMGIGGSATNDGGAGMAAALGLHFLDESGAVLRPVPGILAERLAACDTRGRIPLPPVTAACDVTNPLLGPRGATRVFGRQKGADEQTVPILESALARLVEACAASAAAEQEGAGAAGGLGFGLLQFADAELVPGFSLVAEITGLEQRVAAADWVITGEGSLDAQSLDGKGPFGIARLARKHGKPICAFCGSADSTVFESGWFDHIGSLSSTGLPMDVLMNQAAKLLEKQVAAALVALCTEA